MIYHSVAEVYTAKAAVLERLRRRTHGLTAEQVAFRPTESSWSIAGVAEHLTIVEGQMLKLTGSLLRRTEDAGKFSPGGIVEIHLEEIAERGRREKFTTYDAAVPTGTVGMDASLHRLTEIETELRRLEPRLSAVDLSFASFPHAIFGPLTLGQWLGFLVLHEERHLGQIESILVMPGLMAPQP